MSATLVGRKLRLCYRKKRESVIQTVEVLHMVFKDGKEFYTVRDLATEKEFDVIKAVFDKLFITNHNIKPNWERKFKGETITSKQNKF